MYSPHPVPNSLKHTTEKLERLMVYGMYQEVLDSEGREVAMLWGVYGRLIRWARVARMGVLEGLMVELAKRVGRDVSLRELGRAVGVDKNTVKKYLGVLEECGVIFKVSSFSEKVAIEVKCGWKYFFWDVGVRNLVLGDFREVNERGDVDRFWQNFMVAERRKMLAEEQEKMHFWRSTQKQVVDYVEVLEGGDVLGVDFRWEKRRARAKNATFDYAYGIISREYSREDFMEFLEF